MLLYGVFPGDYSSLAITLGKLENTEFFMHFLVPLSMGVACALSLFYKNTMNMGIWPTHVYP